MPTAPPSGPAGPADPGGDGAARTGATDPSARAELERLLTLPMPDDLAELSAEVTAYHRERRLALHRPGWHRVLFTRRWYSHGLSGPLVGLVLFGVFGVGLLLMILTPRGPVPGRAPLASTGVAAGAVGGLLPAAPLHAGRITAQAPADLLRPAVVLLVADGCQCANAVAGLLRQDASYSLYTYVVAPADSATAERAAGPDGDLALGLTDPTGALTRGLGGVPAGSVARLVVLRSDGVIVASTGVQAGQRIEAELALAAGSIAGPPAGAATPVASPVATAMH